MCASKCLRLSGWKLGILTEWTRCFHVRLFSKRINYSGFFPPSKISVVMWWYYFQIVRSQAPLETPLRIRAPMNLSPKHESSLSWRREPRKMRFVSAIRPGTGDKSHENVSGRQGLKLHIKNIWLNKPLIINPLWSVEDDKRRWEA